MWADLELQPCFFARPEVPVAREVDLAVFGLASNWRSMKRKPSDIEVLEMVDQALGNLMAIRPLVTELVRRQREDNENDGFPASSWTVDQKRARRSFSPSALEENYHDGVGRPTENAAIRRLERIPRDKTGDAIRFIFSVVDTAATTSTNALSTARYLLNLNEKANEERRVLVCLRCQSSNTTLKAGFCEECHDEWVLAGHPDRARFIRAGERMTAV